jgi:glycine betaine/proline transport system substrate-binding protein
MSRSIIYLLLLFLYCSSVVAQQPQPNKNQQPIRVIVNDWTSQRILAKVTGTIFESMGYQVKYPFSTTSEQWGALRHGIDHVQIEVWQGTMADMYQRMLDKGYIVDAGNHTAKTREDWWYPLYVEQLCPGLPDWRALKKCSHLFSLGRGGKAGRYIAGPWEKPEAARIRALGLNFRENPVKTADELWSTLAAAKHKQQAIVLFNWTPNWVEAVYQGKFIEFPEYHPLCETDPEWGVNPNFHHDCGNPKAGWLKKVAWVKMPETWPCAFQTLQNIDFDNKTISTVASWVDFERMSEEAAAQRWLEQNQSRWQNWIPQTCKLNSME